MGSDVEEKTHWTVLTLLGWTSGYLQDKGFENSRLNAERLLAFLLSMRRVDLYLQFDRPLAPAELSQFKVLLKRRAAHEPLQYLLGETEFMSLPFQVGKGVLIPRPETEGLVEKAIDWCRCRSEGSEPIRVLDIGTGSGNVAVALAKNVPQTAITAIDCSSEALGFAGRNAERNLVSGQVEFIQHDLCTGWPEDWRHRFDLIVSNPPYISQADWQALPDEIRNFEPAQALQAGPDGLEFYRIFSRTLPQLMRPEGRLFLEIGENMGEAVQALFSQPAFGEVKIFHDLAGKQRIVTANLTRTSNE